MKVYLLVCVISAVVTWALTPLVRRLARAWGAMTPVRDRDIHTVPTPRMGGVAMLGGIAVGMLVASRIGFLEPVFGSGNRSAWAVLGAAALVVVLGVVDDIWELDWLTKLAGQVLAAGLMAWQGVQLVAFPVGGLTITSSRFSLVVTILVVVVAINAVNFVDGLDGLAAGLVAIGGLALFTYVYLLSRASAPSYATLAGLLAALMVGACLGFLPHNFNPASIFMGDAGSMLLGLLFASATIAVTGQIDPGSSEINTRQALPAFLPILLPFAVLALPLLDMVMAVFRRLRAGQSPFHADRMHLHHRLLAIGHSQRRAVILMYVWTAVLAFPCALLVVLRGRQVLIILVVAVLLAALATFGFARHRVRPGAPAGGGEPRPAAPAGPAHARPVEPAAAPAAGGTSPAPAWRPVPESGSFGTEPPPPGVTGGEGVR